MFKKAMDDWGYGDAMQKLGIAESLDFYGLYHGTAEDENEDPFEWLVGDLGEDDKFLTRLGPV